MLAWLLQLAIFGGTFDPVHKAHLAVAKAARDSFGLDRVLLIPAAVPPHKQDRLGAGFEHRLAMVRLACNGERALEVSDLESGSGKSYSLLTIRRVQEQWAGGNQRQALRLFFVIGADAFSEIRTWYEWQTVVASVEFIVVTRPGHQYEIPEGSRVHQLDRVQMNVSSSDIRARLARCEPPPELPEPVFDYIRKHGLYGFGSACDTYPDLPLSPDPVSR